VEVIDRILQGIEQRANLTQLEDLCETMQHGSLCGLGGMTPFPVMSAIKHFPGDFSRDR
jgi:formate dehydrogenase iron-sulfur subunit